MLDKMSLTAAQIENNFPRMIDCLLWVSLFSITRSPSSALLPFFGGGFPYYNRLQRKTKKKENGYPCSNLSLGGPRSTWQNLFVFFGWDPNHGCCWDTFYMLLIVGLSGLNPNPLICQHILVVAPQTQHQPRNSSELVSNPGARPPSARLAQVEALQAEVQLLRLEGRAPAGWKEPQGQQARPNLTL